MSTRVRSAAAALAAAALVALPTTTPAHATPTRTVATTGTDNQWYLDAMHIREAQQITKGKGVRVCIIDSPIDRTLINTTTTQWAPESSPSSAYKDVRGTDVAGHANRVATMLAGDSTGRWTGTAPEITLEWHPYQTVENPPPFVVDKVGPQQSNASNAIKACADHGAKVISMSFGTSDREDLAVKYAQERDVVLVAASGNGGVMAKGIPTPAGHFGVLTTTGTDRTLRGDHGSTRGGAYLALPPAKPNAYDTQGVAIEGPTTDTSWTLDEGGCKGFVLPYEATNDPLTPRCGTSLATPVVAGIAALVRAAHPDLNAANTINRILKTATLPPGTPPNTTLPSPYFGYGIPNAYKAITATIPPTDHNPLGSLYTGGRGIWQPTTTPRRPEPPTGNHPTPTPWQNVTLDDPANPNPTPSTTSSSSGSNTSSGSGSSSNAATPTNATPTTSGGGTPPWLYPTLATTLTLTAAAITLTRRRRNTTP